ncbi:hypothetical protein [Microcoleus sp. K4-C2]
MLLVDTKDYCRGDRAFCNWRVRIEVAAIADAAIEIALTKAKPAQAG